MNILLVDMNKNESGRIAEIRGGCGMCQRLSAQGLRPGTKIIKVSAGLGRGPSILQIGNSQIALGFGISSKIVVEVIR